MTLRASKSVFARWGAKTQMLHNGKRHGVALPSEKRRAGEPRICSRWIGPRGGPWGPSGWGDRHLERKCHSPATPAGGSRGTTTPSANAARSSVLKVCQILPNRLAFSFSAEEDRLYWRLKPLTTKYSGDPLKKRGSVCLASGGRVLLAASRHESPLASQLHEG